MDFRKVAAGAAGALALFSAGTADAALVLVGSWKVTDGPVSTDPLSAQEAAAQLFGGNAADYSISTAGANVANIDFQAWYLVFGEGSAILGQATKEFFGIGVSAYAYDAGMKAEEDRFVNYAFADRDGGPGIPEPATWALMIGGFGLTGAALRRRRAAAA